MSHQFNVAVGRLADRVGHWTPSRWAASGASDVMYALIQRLADAAADAEGQPRRRVPRLDNDLALTDQFRVIAADLVAARPDRSVLEGLTAQVTATF